MLNATFWAIFKHSVTEEVIFFLKFENFLNEGENRRGNHSVVQFVGLKLGWTLMEKVCLSISKKKEMLIAGKIPFLNELLQSRTKIRILICRFIFQFSWSRCLKITQKVSFNIASEASYVYILSGQKFIKNAKNGEFWRAFENLKLAVKQCYQRG